MNSLKRLPILAASLGCGWLVGFVLFPTEATPWEAPLPSLPPLQVAVVQTNMNQFTWHVLETTDYSKYVSNLRRIRCPEATIYDIVKSDLLAAHANQLNAIRLRYDFREKQDEIMQQIDSMLCESLRLQKPLPASAVFSPVQLRKIEEAMKLYPLLSLTQETRKASASRLEFLKPYLPGNSMTYYKLLHEGLSGRVREFAENATLSKNEFLALAEIVDSNELTFGNPFTPDVQASLRAVLSPANFESLVTRSSTDVVMVTAEAERLHISKPVIAQLVALHLDLYSRDKEAYMRKVSELLPPNIYRAYITNQFLQ